MILIMKTPCVYMISNKKDGVLYTGVTSNLQKRIWEHKHNIVEGFSKKYNLKTLVWYEIHETMEAAIIKEKQIKKWERAWKVKRIEKNNLKWTDLYYDL